MKRILYVLLTIPALFWHRPGSAQTYVPEKGNALVTVKPKVDIKAWSFDLKAVRLLESPFKKAMEADAGYLLSIEPDRLLCDFRKHAGLPPKGKKYGGWESEGLAGHTLGHYLSACSMAWAATGDRRYLERVNYIVDELALCQKARKTGYIGAIPNEDSLWAEVARGEIRSHGFDLNGAWSPWYTVHKIMAGLLDAYLYTGIPKALRVEKGMADWTGRTIGLLSDSLMQKMLLCEYGGMNEVLVNTYAITGNKKYLVLSERFHDRRVLDSLALHTDILPGKHANTQVPKVIGCARRYELTGNEKDRDIARFFWQTVVHNHSYATGGNSNYEYLGKPRVLNDQLTDNTTETCVTYNMLKLTRHLFSWAPSAGLMDYYERGLYNHILASQNHEDGMMCYFVPLRMGTRKEYSDSFNTFTCCVGTGMENHVKYAQSIYSRGSDGSLLVNLFIPSRLTWAEKGITVEQQTRLPVDDKVYFTIGMQKPATFAIRIRKPAWAGTGIDLKVNGRLQNDIVIDPEGYLLLSRTWKDGDRVELTLPMKVYTVSMPDNPNRVALFYGPVLLAGVFGNTEPDPVKGIPVLVTADPDPNRWIKRDNAESLVFHSHDTGRPIDVTLIPFNQTGNEYYSVYWDVFTPEGWEVRQRLYEAERKQQQELEQRTVDRLRLGEMQPERDHRFTGDNIYTGEAHGKKWRAAGTGGSFSFVMKVDSSGSDSLRCTYWGDDYRDRIFEIQVDGQTIATQNLQPFRQSRFYEISYALPPALVKGRQSVTITFRPKEKYNAIGPLFGTIRMIKGD